MKLTTKRVRRYLVVLLAGMVVASPAIAARLNPALLVLRQADVPAGFRLDRATSGVRSNANESKGEPEVRALFVRAGRVTGYETRFERGQAEISSRADVFRTPAGARMVLRWFGKELAAAFPGSVRRTAVDLGAEGSLWVVDIPSLGSSTVIAWRHGHAFAGVAGEGLTRERTLSFARLQDRRIAAALR